MKPPKVWLTEYSKKQPKQNTNHHNYGGGGNSSSFQNRGGNNKNGHTLGSVGKGSEDDFRNYMARKIELQRQQFGLIIPPPPPPTTAEETDNISSVPPSKSNQPSKGKVNTTKKNLSNSSVNSKQNHGLHGCQQLDGKKDKPVLNSRPSSTSPKREKKKRRRRHRHETIKNKQSSSLPSQDEMKGLPGVLNRLKAKYGDSACSFSATNTTTPTTNDCRTKKRKKSSNEEKKRLKNPPQEIQSSAEKSSMNLKDGSHGAAVDERFASCCRSDVDRQEVKDTINLTSDENNGGNVADEGAITSHEKVISKIKESINQSGDGLLEQSESNYHAEEDTAPRSDSVQTGHVDDPTTAITPDTTRTSSHALSVSTIMMTSQGRGNDNAEGSQKQHGHDEPRKASVDENHGTTSALFSSNMMSSHQSNTKISTKNESTSTLSAHSKSRNKVYNPYKKTRSSFSRDYATVTPTMLHDPSNENINDESNSKSIKTHSMSLKNGGCSSGVTSSAFDGSFASSRDSDVDGKEVKDTINLTSDENNGVNIAAYDDAITCHKKVANKIKESINQSGDGLLEQSESKVGGDTAQRSDSVQTGTPTTAIATDTTRTSSHTLPVSTIMTTAQGHGNDNAEGSQERHFHDEPNVTPRNASVEKNHGAASASSSLNMMLSHQFSEKTNTNDNSTGTRPLHNKSSRVYNPYKKARSSFTRDATVTPIMLHDQSNENLNAKRNSTPISHKAANRPDLFFSGIVILINGYTEPSADTLMRTLHRHGGDLEKYETSRVTHIIAEALSDAKVKAYQKQKRPLPIVHTRWILDCQKAQKLLPHGDYLLEQLKDQNQANVKSFFQSCSDGDDKKKDDCATVIGDNDCGKKIMDTRSEMESRNNNPYPRSTSNEDHNTFTLETNQLLPTPSHLSSASKSDDTQRNASHTVIKPSTSSNISSIRTVGTDPNFLESYFNTSRLSFIGSFHQRIPKVLPSKFHERNFNKSSNKISRVFHIDMDCFFAAVTLRKYPQYKDKPVAIGHSWNSDPNGTHTTQPSHNNNSRSELSTANYVARKYGVRKGMFLNRARELCPHLIVLPYDYEGYEEVSKQLGNILDHHVEIYGGTLEQVSCDEAYMKIYLDDCTKCKEITRTIDKEQEDEKDRRKSSNLCDHLLEKAKAIGEAIRKEILTKTMCTASIGIGSNKLLAKLATDCIKPNGLYAVENWKSFLKNIKLRDLPGIGYQSEKKLTAVNLQTVQDVWFHSTESELQQVLGPVNGKKVYQYCHGKDDRKLEPSTRKTIGAECNYGVRFDGPYGVDHMMNGLSNEVERRMQAVGVLGRSITLKLKERIPGSGPPGKFNGMGSCNDHSKSCSLPISTATRDASIMCRVGMRLFNEIGIEKTEVRGVGIIISKLESEDSVIDATVGTATASVAQSVPPQLSSWLQESKKSKKQYEIENTVDATTKCRNYYQTPNRNMPNTTAQHVEQPPVSIVSRSIKKRANSANSRRRKSTTTLQKGQMNVKKMFKLAEVKSSKSLNGEQVSLTQLDTLPLEIQLEVVNDKEKVGSSIKRYQPNRHSTSEGKHSGDEGVITLDETPIQPVNAFYVDNVQPLRQWMNSILNPKCEHIQKLLEFLYICVDEKRLDDVVIFLRLIQETSHWNIHFKYILATVNKYLVSMEERCVDSNLFSTYTIISKEKKVKCKKCEATNV